MFKKKTGIVRILFIAIFVVTHSLVIYFAFFAGSEDVISTLKQFSKTASNYASANKGKYWESEKVLGSELPANGEFRFIYFSSDQNEDSENTADKFVLIAIPKESSKFAAYYLDETLQIWEGELVDAGNSFESELGSIVFLEEFWLIDDLSRCDSKGVRFRKYEESSN